MQRVSRLAGAAMAALLVCAAAIVGVLHTPPGRALARTAVVSWLQSQGIAVSIERLTYNLLTLTVDLRGVRMRAAQAETPFLTADRIEADVPWSMLGGDIHIETIALTRPVVRIVRQADGTLNLPAGGTGGGPPLPRLRIARLQLQEAVVSYDDARARHHVEVRNLTLGLDAAVDGGRGRLAPGGRVSARAGDVALQGTLAGVLAYDGVGVTLDALGLTSELGAVRLDGRADIFGASPTLALGVSATIALEPVSKAFAIDPVAAGTVTLTGRVDGPRDNPAATVDARSDEIRWQHLVAHTVAVRATVTGEQVTVAAASARLGTGVLEARADYTFDSRQAHAAAAWRDVPIHAIAAMDASAVGRTRLSGQADMEAVLTDAARTLGLEASVSAETAGARTLDGRLSLSSAGDDWQARATLGVPGDARVQGAFNGRLARTGVADATVRGSVALDAPDLPRLTRTAARLELWPADWPAPASGGLQARVEVGGTLGAPTARGALTLATLRARGLGPLDARAELVVDPGQFALRGLEGAVGGNRLVGDAAVSRTRDTLSGHVELAVTDVDALGDDAVARWHPAGRLHAAIDLGGTTAAPSATITASGSGLSVAGQDLGTLAATATASASTVALSTAELRQSDGGRLVAAGQYGLDGHALTLRVQADALLLSPVWVGGTNALPLAGQVNGSIEIGGTTGRPTGGGRLDVTDLQWTDAYLERVVADLALADGMATVDLDAPVVGLRARTVTTLADPYETTVTVDATDTDVATAVVRAGSFAPPLLREFSGRLRASVTATGTPAALEDAAADVRLDTLDLTLRGAALQLAEPVVVQYRAGDVVVQSFRIRTGGTQLELHGGLTPRRSDGLRASLQGTVADLRPWMAAFGAPDALDAAGRITLTAGVTGTVDQPTLTADVQVAEGRFAWPNAPAVTDVTATMTLRDGVVDVPAIDARWQQGGSLHAQARIPLRFLDAWMPDRVMPAAGARTATAQVRLDRLTPALAAPWIDAATLGDVSGTAAVDVDLSAERPELDAVTGTLRIPQLDLMAHGVPLQQRRPTRVELASGELRVVDWAWTLAGSPLVLSGTAALRPDGALNLRVDGPLDLAVLGLFLPGGAADGTGDIALSLGGTPSAPVADGTLHLKDGELSLSDPRVGLSGLTGALVFRPGRIDARDIAGTLNGGRVTLAGGLDYRGTTFTGGSVSIDASNVALDVPEGVRTEVNAALAFAATDERLRLTGRLDILRGGYREPLSLAAALALAGRDAAVAAGPGTAEPSPLDEIDLNVAVSSAEDLLVDNNYGRLALGLDLRLVGTVAQPSVVGRAEIREGGALFLGGRTYLVDRGVIDFSDPRAIVPNLDVTGRTRVDGANESGSPTTYDITLEITGTPETLKTALTSSPDRSQADIVSLLATGRLADQVGGAGTAIARDQFLGYLSGETLGFAARAIGVDAIRFERGAGVEDLSSDASLAGEVNPAQRLTVSRRITNKAEVTLSQNLRDTGRQTWIAALMPGRSIELRALSRDDTSRSYEIRHDIAFGGPPLPPAPSRRAAGTPVAAVRVTGETVIPAQEVERHLRLRAGRRFDFLRWQEDRDRLRQLYVERGYREARITARQVPTPLGDGSPGVTLEYEITAHAPTVVEIEGADLPASVRQQIDRIWDQAILDVGLVGDVAATVRTHLAGEGYLRARVRVRREPATPSDPRTRLHVRVAPGPRSTARTLDVTGQTLIDTGEISRLAEVRGPSAWLAPDTLAEDILRRYRQLGRLAATVEAGPVVFDGDRATLPVRITEGAPFIVGRVTITGATARTEPAARRDLTIAAGEAYTPDLLPRGRQALITAYAVDGFNATEVAIGATVDVAAAAVHLQVTVAEGVQQIVSDISITGADGVASGVVNRALQLSPGTPANLETLYRGRRRLFQTGLFRRADVEIAPMADIAAGPGVEPVRAEVTLVRMNPWRVRYGVSVTDELGPIVEQGRTFGGGANVALERQGLFGRPGAGMASFRYNDDQQVARGSVAWPTLFGRAISSRFYASRARDSVSGENILSFVTDRTTFTAEQRLSVGTRTQIAYAYQLERNHVFAPDADPDDPFALDERWRQSRLSASLVFDNRRDLTEPNGGLLHSSTVEYGLESLGRNGRFVKYSLQELHFVPVGARMVSASAVRLNVGRGFGGQDLIFSERFLAGGTNTVRGYADDGLAGFDFFGDPISGQATLVLNQEARVTLTRSLRAVAFVDAGQVFERAGDLSLGSLQWATGVGFRVRTPVGLFRFDVAAPLPRRDLPIRYHFGFGHMF